MGAHRIQLAVVLLIASLIACASNPEQETAGTLMLAGIVPTELGTNQLIYENLDTGKKVSLLFTKRTLKLEPVPPGNYRLVRVEGLYENVLGGNLAPEDHPAFRVKAGFINYVGAVRVDRVTSTHSHVVIDVRTYYPPRAIDAAREIWPEEFTSHEVHTAVGTQ